MRSNPTGSGTSIDHSSYDAAVAALMSPVHQATDQESLRKSAARRVKTVTDMRKYWGRIRWGNCHGQDGSPNTGASAPQRMIHITGTKGKGSTASLCQAILQSHGYSTGLFTSPHLIDIRERIRLDGRPVHVNIFAKAYWKIRKDLEDYEGTEDDLPKLPGYFRMLTLMAFYIFSHLQVDIWIIEVGMGGRFDATNFLDRDTIQHRSICGVTLLDLDHTRILGNTLEQIAWEKGGIFAVDKETTLNLTPRPNDAQPDVTSKNEQLHTESNKADADADPSVNVGASLTEPAVADRSPVEPPKKIKFSNDPSSTFYILDSNTDGVLQVFRQCAAKEGRGGVLQPVDAKGTDLRKAMGKNHLGLAGDHQYGNATLAMRLCHAATVTQDEETGALSPSYDAFSKDEKTLKGLTEARWPARCQTVVPPGPPFTFRLDGAHTPQSLTATIEWFLNGDAILNPRRVLIFNCSHERDPVELLQLLQVGKFTAVYFARSDSSRPSPIPKPKAQELLKAAGIPVQEGWIAEVRTHPDKETWQETLGIIWKHLMSKVPPSLARPGASPGRHTQHYRVPMTCNKSAAEIVKELSTSIIEPTEILVTGSLYIVGSFLTALEWSEEASPDLSKKLPWFEEPES